MKKGYIRLLIFEFFVCIVLFLNSFVWNILSKHVMNIFLLILIILFKLIFGVEKDRHRYVKDIMMDAFIFLVIFFMLYYLFGIIVTFTKLGNYYNLKGLTDFIIPILFLVLFREYLRYNVLNKSEGSKLVTAVGIVLFIWIDISTAIYYRNFANNYNIFIFIALTLLPAISNNIAYSYVTLKTGYKPVMLFSLVMSLYYYVMPIVPNPNEYIASIINLIIPLVLLYKTYSFFKKASDEDVERDYKKTNYSWLIISGCIVVVLVYFTSGYFKYWAIAVASGSMSPAINKGDVVVIENIGNNYSGIKKGDVLAFRYDGVTIVHRVINIAMDKDHYYFYTKGDANRHEDDFKIEEDMVLGVVNVRIPFIGGPTVWLNEL